MQNERERGSIREVNQFKNTEFQILSIMHLQCALRVIK